MQDARNACDFARLLKFGIKAPKASGHWPCVLENMPSMTLAFKCGVDRLLENFLKTNYEEKSQYNNAPNALNIQVQIGSEAHFS